MIASHCSALGESLTELFFRQCIGDVSRSPTRQAIVTTVMTYASYCDIILRPPGLATDLCSKEMDFDFSRQYMCLQHDHCRFGDVDVFTGQCVCDTGYWGPRCSAVCPGGPIHTCSDRGQCRSKTGECECDTRWLDSSNCTECNKGWSGPDCSEFTFPNNVTQPSDDTTTVKPPDNETIIDNATTVKPPVNGTIIDPQTAAIFGQGHVSTFASRVIFTLAALGEFHLLRSTDLRIQVKTVGCYDQSVCIEAVAISHGVHHFVVRSGYTSKEQSHMWYNGKHLNSDNTNFVNDVFRVTHDATFVVNVVVGAVAKLAVKQVHRHLSVTLVVSYTECSNQDSVLGDCGVGAVVTADSSGERWRVAAIESLFSVLYASSSIGETNSTYGGGHCLFFDGESSVTSGVLTDVFHHTTDLSLEFYMRTISIYGVIISYGVTGSFSLYLDKTIKLYIQGVVYNTNMTVSVGQWCKVTVVWQATSKFLSVYVNNERGVITTSDLHIKYNGFFKSGGSLLLGKTLTMTLGGFVGEIDEIVVWHKALLYQDIQKAWMMNHQGKERDIAALWKFDEGEGVTIHDLVSSSHLQWAVYSWSSHQPQWRYSEARLDVLGRKKAFFFTDDALATNANEKCIRMFAVLQPNCFDTVAQSVYTELCVQDVAASSRLDVSLHVVVAVADICMAEKHLSKWPAQSLCNEFASDGFPYYVGSDCNIKCYFGATESGVAESCHCHDGYWGPDCSRLCPGGRLNSCSGHGRCIQETGKCECAYNWVGTPACSVCSNGFHGADCSVANTTAGVGTSVVRTASVTVNGYWTLLDGAGIVYKGTGIYVFFRQQVSATQQLQVEVMQTVCASFDVCVRAIAVQISDSTLVISAAGVTSQSDVLYINGSVTNIISTEALVFAHGFMLERIDQTEYILRGTDGFELDVFIGDGHLIVQMSTASSGNVYGLLGFTGYTSINQTAIVAFFGSWQLNDISTSIFNRTTQTMWSTHKAVSFNNTTASMVDLRDITTTDHLTFELTFRLETTAATVLLSYTTNDMFTLAVNADGMLTIHHNVSVLHTGITVERGSWAMVAVVYKKSTHHLTVVYTSVTGKVVYRTFVFSIGDCESGGSLVLGGIQSSTGVAVARGFVGAVARLIMWERWFTAVEVITHWNINIPRGELGLTHAWVMSEGLGGETLDIRGASVLYLHPDCTWINYDVPASDVSVSVNTRVSFSTEVLEVAARDKCSRLFYHGALSTSCGSLTVAVAYYHSACLHTIATTQSVESSLNVVISFASTCQKVKQLSIWPAKSMCNDFTGEQFPRWIGADCNQRCIFGHVNAMHPDVCTCDTGYWGDACDHPCPGSVTEPCHGHGVCTRIGKCQCQLNWNGNSECSACTADYGGTNCSFIKPHYTSKIMVCQVDRGKTTNFKGYTFKVKKPATYHLIHTQHFSLQVQQIVCKRRMCVVNAELTFYNHTVKVVPKTQEYVRKRKSRTRTVIEVSLDNTQLSRTTSVILDRGCVMKVSKQRRNKYTVTVTDVGLRVTFTGRYGAIRVVTNLNDTSCCDEILKGLCGNCGACSGKTLTLPQCPLMQAGYSDGNDTGIVNVDTSTTGKSLDEMIEGTIVHTYAPVTRRGAGRCICFTDSTAVTNEITLFAGRYTTIEFLLRTCAADRCHGTVLSFSGSQTFALLHQDTVKIVHGGNFVFDSGVALPDNKWTFISIVLDNKKRHGKLHIFADGDMPVMKEFWYYDKVTRKTFIGMGRWQLSEDGTFHNEIDHFVGCVDQLRIWHRIFGPYEIYFKWNIALHGNEPKLAYLWTFDELSDDKISDEVNGMPMMLPRRPFPRPVLQVSDAPIRYQPQTPQHAHDSASRRKRRQTTENELTLQQIEQFCDDLFYEENFQRACSRVGDALVQSHREDCITDVTDKNDKDAAVDSVVALADYCEEVLALSDWPARHLCSHFNDTADFSVWIGAKCDKPCHFGHADPEDHKVCVCSKGYWDTSCHSECPGGATSLCSGLGPCNTSTGSCDCPVNRRGSDDCSVCSNGWHGTDCSVMFQSTATETRVMAKLTDTGHVHTVDGFDFRLTNVGEYHLLNLFPYVMMESKLIRCHQHFSCVAFVGVRLGDDSHGFTTLTVHLTPDMTFEFTLNEFSSVIDSTLNFYGFNISRLSASELAVNVGSDLQVIIRAVGVYLDTSVVMSRDLVNATDGILCGRGGDSISDATMYILASAGYSQPLSNIANSMAPAQKPQMSQPSPTYELPLAAAKSFGNVHAQDSHNLSQAAMNAYVDSWSVHSNDTIISYPSVAYQAQTLDGYSLKFHNTSAYSVFQAQSVIGSDVTFEMFVKAANGNGSGVLFSYASSQVFAVVSEDTLVVQVNGSSYNTGLSLEEEEWNKVVIAYKGDSGRLDAYVFSSEVFPHRGMVMLPTHMFIEDGTLALGQWQPPRSGWKHKRPDSFDGCIDSFLVWGIRIEAALIKDVWDMNLHDAATLLNANWQFDEGQRDLAVDSLQGHGLRLPGRPWVSPHWVPSGIPARKATDVNPLTDTCKDKQQRRDATSMCLFLLRNTSMAQQCLSVHSTIVDMYVFFCQQEVCINTGDISAARKVALDFADACMFSSSLAAWPGKGLCGTIGGLRSGTQCYDTCRFGTTSSNGQCECNEGYTGPHCDQLCPGGTQSPCSRHGRCTEAGDCDCDHNWQGHSCDSCAELWYGSDCSVLVTSPFHHSSTTRVAFVTPTATYHTFDHVQFVVGNKVGVFSIFELSGDRVKIQVHQVLCDLPSCVDAVALQVGSETVTVYAEKDTKQWPTVHVGRTKLNYGEMSRRVSDNFDVSLLSTEKIMLHVKEPYLLNVTVYLMHHFLHVTVEANTNTCQNTTGILGSCDGDVDNDVPINKSTVSLSSIVGNVSQQYQVAEDQSLFDSALLKRLSLAGYAMSLNSTATTSDVLSHAFSNATLKSSTGSSNKDVTVSLLVKPVSHGGIIVAYGKRNTFALTNDVNVTIHCGQDSFVTSTSNSIGEWNQLVLAYERDNRRLHYYHMNSVGGLTYETFDIDCADLMDIGGRVTLGSWQAAGDNVSHTVTRFDGQIDDMSVWLTRLPHAVIYQLFHLNVRPSMFASKLAYLYTFVEDDGPTARDIMGAADFHGAQSPWQHPTWLPSDLEVYDLPSNSRQQMLKDNGKNNQHGIEIVCDSFFMSPVVKTSSTYIDNKIREHFHSQCRQSGRRSANVMNAYFTMASFVELSRVVSRGQNDLHTVLCSGPLKQQPLWLRRDCAGCIFGTLDENGKCKCYLGYWGSSCSNRCPGDRATVCSGHGECLRDGRCHCEDHYTGIMCENVTCTDGSIAADCSVTRMSSDHLGVTAVAHLRSQTIVTTLDGTTFQLPDTGVYEVFAIKSFNLWATVFDCDTPTRKARCFDSLLLSYDGQQVLVKRSSSSTSHMTVWADGRAVEIRSRRGLSGINMVRAATYTLEMSFERLHTMVIVAIETNGLSATLVTTKPVWRAATGLLSSCNTSVSIQATGCSVVVDPCTTTALPLSCQKSLSESAVKTFSAQFLLSPEDDPANTTSLVTSIYCEGSGLFTENINWLPRGGFDIELHIKPMRYGGVFFSYINSHVLAIVNDVTGLHVHYNNHIYTSGLVLALNVWSQLDLYWDVSMATLHVYLTKTKGDTRVFAVQLTASAFSPSGTMSFGELPADVSHVVNANIHRVPG
ncbi:hypothetical protein LSAT2_008506 [Lamellibrachia satsuma]|nr:hypothetical protein LSAT2_008506 [Lamellibrachia satsuma]